MRWKDSKETGSSGSFKKEAGWRQSRGGRKTFHALITPLESLSYLFTKYTTVEWKRKSSIQMCSRTYKAIRPSVVNDRKCRGDTYVCQSGTRHISDGSNQFSLTRTDFGDKWKNRKVQDSVIECYHLSFWKKKIIHSRNIDWVLATFVGVMTPLRGTALPSQRLPFLYCWRTVWTAAPGNGDRGGSLSGRAWSLGSAVGGSHTLRWTHFCSFRILIHEKRRYYSKKTEMGKTFLKKD